MKSERQRLIQRNMRILDNGWYRTTVVAGMGFSAAVGGARAAGFDVDLTIDSILLLFPIANGVRKRNLGIQYFGEPKTETAANNIATLTRGGFLNTGMLVAAGYAGGGGIGYLGKSLYDCLF